MAQEWVFSRRAEWTIWLRWVLANALGGLIGFGLGIVLSLGPLALNLFLGLTVLGGVVYAALSGAQWLVLRPYLPAAPNAGARWVGSSTLAGGFAVPITSLILLYAASVLGPAGNPDPVVTSGIAGTIVPVVVTLLIGAVAGLIVGMVQALVMRPAVPRFSGPWIGANGIGLALGVPLAAFVDMGLSTIPTIDLLQAMVSPVLMGMIAVTGAAAITGLALTQALGPQMDCKSV